VGKRTLITPSGALAAHAAQIRSGEIRAIELTADALSAARDDPRNAFVTITGERATAGAERIDSMIESGIDPGPLAGIPLGVKDVHDVEGIRTHHGCLAFVDAPPAPANSTIVEWLEAAGAIVIGKTSTSELEFSATTENPLTGVTEHPTVAGRTPGGSSGGSAVAVATGMVDLATGTDGGGSLRIPASACGLPGLKLSPGRISTVDGWGQPAPWGSLTSTGVFGQDLHSTLLAYDILLRAAPGEDNGQTSLQRAALEGTQGSPPRLAWMPNLGWAKPSPPVAAICSDAVDAMADAGAIVEEVKGFEMEDPALIWTRLAASLTRRWLERHPARPELGSVSPKLRMLLDRWGDPDDVALSKERLAADSLRTGLETRLRGFTALLCPTVVGLPPVHADAARAGWVRNTYYFNLTQSPAATISAGSTSDGLPVGLQIVSGRGRDSDVVRTMAWAAQVLSRRG
jgi:aspartyl-tRNA(Asn)/glutamyl-tRNA(Gln) amidotransferase subunit A